MSFCSLVAQNHGISVLTMTSTDGHQYLTDEAITELVDTLEEVRKEAKQRGLRGLVTSSKTGSFCDGIDRDNITDQQAAHLAKRMAEVIRLLLEMPAPTVAAVGGNATSLGLALALAHDHLVVWDDAVLGLPEAQRGRPVPEYVAALLRDKLAYARLRKLLLLRSQACTGKELTRTWWSAHKATDDRHAVVDGALELLEEVDVGDGTDFAKARQTICPESCAAVGVVTRQPPSLPSFHEGWRYVLDDTSMCFVELITGDKVIRIFPTAKRYLPLAAIAAASSIGRISGGGFCMHKAGRILRFRDLIIEES